MGYNLEAAFIQRETSYLAAATHRDGSESAGGSFPKWGQVGRLGELGSRVVLKGLSLADGRGQLPVVNQELKKGPPRAPLCPPRAARTCGHVKGRQWQEKGGAPASVSKLGFPQGGPRLSPHPIHPFFPPSPPSGLSRRKGGNGTHRGVAGQSQRGGQIHPPGPGRIGAGEGAGPPPSAPAQLADSGPALQPAAPRGLARPCPPHRALPGARASHATPGAAHPHPFSPSVSVGPSAHSLTPALLTQQTPLLTLCLPPFGGP